MAQENTKTKTENTEPKAADTTVESDQKPYEFDFSSQFWARPAKWFHDKESHSFVNGE